MWSLPLIALCVVIHVIGLGLMNEYVINLMSALSSHGRFLARFAIFIGLVALLTTALHALEAMIWAVAYRLLGVLPDIKSAMLYSLSALTTYGHASQILEPRWEMMGAIEALNGVLLFGLTTAFLFAVIQRVWPLGSRRETDRDLG
jgi:hypothetical protein